MSLALRFKVYFTVVPTGATPATVNEVPVVCLGTRAWEVCVLEPLSSGLQWWSELAPKTKLEKTEGVEAFQRLFCLLSQDLWFKIQRRAQQPCAKASKGPRQNCATADTSGL